MTNVKGLDGVKVNKVNTPYYIITTENKKKVPITADFIKMSGLLTTMGNDKEARKFPLDKISSERLHRVMEYVNHYGTSFPSYGKHITHELKNDVTEWDLKFLNKPPKTLLQLFKDSNYLIIKPLYKLCSIYFAHWARHTTPGDMEKALK